MNARFLTLVFSCSAFAGLFCSFTDALAQSAQQNSYWELMSQTDKYFNKAGSVLPERYAQKLPTPVTHRQAQLQAPHTYPQNQPRISAQNESSSTHVPTLDVTAQNQSWRGIISELRFGVLSHDAKFPSRHGFDAPNPFANRYESGININPEVVFVSPNALNWLWNPRPHVGVSINTSGDTSSLYSGLGWDTTWDNKVFLEGFFGLAVHDGKLHDGNSKSKIEFGSRALFRLGGELGWRWDEHNGFSFLWEHMSNGGIMSGKNQGIDSLGLRYSYRFD